MAVSSATSSATTGTNIDVNGIVGKLMAVEQKPLTALNTKEASYQSKISAFGQVKGALSAFQTALQGLSSISKFQANVATSSDPSVFTASALSSAAVGSHVISVNSLAQAQRLAAPGLASSTTAIGSGTLTFDFGTVADGTFNPNVGKYRISTLSNATITNRPTTATPGSTITVAKLTPLTPDADSSGIIPAGTLTINGVKVGEINLLDADSPMHRAINIAEAFDDAYVESGGEAGTITAEDGQIKIKAESGGKRVSFGITGNAPDAATATKNLTTLASQTGLSTQQLGTQAYNISNVTVPTTAGLSVGDTISGGGFPDRTTVSEIVDATHFLTTSAGKDNTSDSEGTTLNTSSMSSSRTVAIDSGNNSLQGIRDSINAAKIGVTASIVNDGSEAPNRLVLTSDSIGSKSNMKVTVGGGDPALTRLLSYDPVGNRKLTEIAAAKDTSLIVDGIEVTKDSNSIKDVIQGVTLNLLKPSTSPVTLDIGRDTATVKTSVEEFVKGYNELKKVITDLTAYNAATKKGAPLQGDSAMRSLESQIDTMLSTPLGTPAGSLTTLSQIGVSKQTNGSLAIDSTKLDSAINTKFNDVAGLFASIGKATDSLVNFKTTSPATLPGNYAVAVTQLASQGSTTGAVNLNFATTTIESGTTITASVDGTSSSVALPSGTYAGEDLAKMVQEAINSTAAFSARGKTVTASLNRNGFLNIASNTYGSTSSVTLGGDNGKQNAGMNLSRIMGMAVSKQGNDVVGTINGAAATGVGQLLTSSEGNSIGLQVQIAGGTLGDRGTVNYTQGYAQKLNDFTNTALGNTGVLTGRMDGLGASVKGIAKERDAINARLVTIEDRYRRQYTKLDAAMSNMNTTSTYLSQQLAKM